MMADEDNNRAPYDPTNDSSALKEAFQGGKETIEKIVDIICNLTNAERQELKEKYMSDYGENLLDKLSDKLSGNLKDLILGLMDSSVDYDSKLLCKSMKGAGTDEELLNEVIISRPCSQIKKIVERYPQLYKESLNAAITDDTSKEYRNLLLAMVAGKRSENPYPNKEKTKERLRELEDSEGKLNKDNIVKYFANCSFGELCALFRMYEKEKGESFYTRAARDLTSDFRDLIKEMLCYISDSGKFFADKINKFKEEIVVRILISRNEVDMDEIRDAYKDEYKKELVDDIKDKYSSNPNLQKAFLILAQK